MQTLNSLQQRWIALGLLFIMIISVATLIIVPWLSALSEIHDDIDAQVLRIKRYQRVIASREEVLSDIEQGRKDINALNYFNAQTSSSLATAELQNTIKTMTIEAGGELSSSQVLPNKDQDGLLLIAVKVKLTSNMQRLRSLLYAIETAKPLMIIEGITVLPAPKKRNRRTRLIKATEDIMITLRVSSYMRKQAQ